MKSTKIPTTLAGIALLGAAVALAAWPSAKKNQEQQLRPAAVRVDEVTLAANRSGIRLAGVARAAQQARLAFVLPGRLAGRTVEVGDRVRHGQVLAELDSSEFRLAEAAAESALAELDVRLDQARRDEARVARLKDVKAATTEEVELAATSTRVFEASKRSAGVRLAEAQRLISESKLFAPFDGTITGVDLEPGEWAGKGQTVVELAGENNLEVEVEAPETVFARLAEDQEVIVELSLRGAETIGRVSSQARAAGGPGRLFPIIISLEPHPDLVPGTTVEVLLEVEERESLSLPLEAILNPGSSRPSVFRVRNGRADQVFVELGRLDGGHIAVVADLTVGDAVVVAGHTALADGDLVEVRR